MMQVSGRFDSTVAPHVGDVQPRNVAIRLLERHVHLTANIIEQLFCDHYELHIERATSQLRHFAAQEMVTLVGPRGCLRNVRVIGPARALNQIEVSSRDALVLGLTVPIRASGDLIGTPGIILRGPRTQVFLGNGVIRAQRQIYMNPEEASGLGLKDCDLVSTSIKGLERGIFNDARVRVSPDYRMELYLDRDEAIAGGLQDGSVVVLSIAQHEHRSRTSSFT